MPATPIVHYWHSDELPDQVSEYLRRFREHNPEMRQLVFSESSAEQFIADRYGTRAADAFRACAVPTMQADYFRYCAVHSLGGIYADANGRCLASLSALVDGPAQAVLFGREDPVPPALAALYGWPWPVGRYRAVTNGLFAFREPGHPFMELAVEIATANIEQRVADGPKGIWVVAGPGVFTSMYLLRELGSIDAFLDYSAGTALEPSAPTVCRAIGDYDRIARAFDGVSILPEAERDAFGVKDRSHKPRWDVREGSIFRSDETNGEG